MYIICSKFKELHMEYESDDVWKRRSSRDVWIGKVIGKAYYYVDIFAPLKRYSLCGYESSNGARDLDIGFQFFAVYECLKDCFKKTVSKDMASQRLLTHVVWYLPLCPLATSTCTFLSFFYNLI